MIIQSVEGKPVGIELEVKKKKLSIRMVDMGRDSRLKISARQGLSAWYACLGPRYHYQYATYVVIDR